MGKSTKIELTIEQIDWLRQANDLRVHPTLMAIHLGYHVDTIKRLLDRYGIKEALSSKHITTGVDVEPTWSRPCMRCKSTSPRPKNQYVCDKCKQSSETSGLHDDYLFY